MSMKHIGYYALVLSCLIASCEDEMRDTEVPTVRIISPAADTKLWLEVTAAAEVIDDQSVSRVEFYLNDDLLGEDTEAPYELKFNSKKYEDGKYTLKTVAYDGANNQSSATREIEIFNTLLEVNVGESYLSDDLEKWLVIANTQGKVTDYAMMENGKNINFKRSEGMESEEFHTMIIDRYLFSSQSEYININEYHGVLPSIWTLSSSGKGDSLGTAKITYTYGNEYRMNISSHNISESNWNNNYYVEFDSMISRATLTIEKKPASVFVNVVKRNDNNEPPQYVFIKDLAIGSEHTLSQKEFISMKVGQTTILPENKSLSINVYGVSDEEIEYQLYYNFLNKEATNLITYIPENGFKDYSYRLGLSLDQYHSYKFDKGLPSSTYTMPQFNLEITDISLESFSTTIEGEADFSTIVWKYNEYDELGHRDMHRYVYTNVDEGKVEVKFTEIPTEILKKYPLLQNHHNDVTYTHSSINNYEGISSLSDYLNLIYSPNYKTPYYENITIYPDNSNARLSKVKLPKHLQEEKIRRGETW
ncbi:Ig-like domain-containing protein [Catalinimonas niigatensis]|uniref:Ig-like domain-containing protein n=1 Tax=Catalinimonas niigatensis TaxID=1397264 RepID=UPI00266606F9|nr:Ig-like domain-containing protein [Catalinimonas niigatensis]WPP50385.1 Ig-like domain-containing protein [Catalinimonas niigatensis]